MGATLTTIADILKLDYADAIKEQLNNKNAFLERFDRNADVYDHKGGTFTFPTHISRNEGIGSRGDGGALPTAGSQGYKYASIPKKYSYGVIQLTRQAIQASKTDEKAFRQALGSEMKGLLMDLKNNQDRQLYNDGMGTLATCASASGTSVTVDSTRNLRVGQAIDVCVAASGAESHGKLATTVSSITSATVFVVGDALSNAAGIDGTFAVFAASSRGLEPYGLGAIVATTDTVTSGFAGLAVASYPVWKSTLTNHNAALTELAMQKMLDDVDQAGPGKTSLILTTHGVNRAYGDMMAAQRMFIGSTTMDGGVKAPAFNGVPILADKYCPSGVMWFLDESDLVHLVLQDWEWADNDGEILKWVSGYDAYTAYMCKYDNVACYTRNAHGKLYGVTEA